MDSEKWSVIIKIPAIYRFGEINYYTLLFSYQMFKYLKAPLHIIEVADR